MAEILLVEDEKWVRTAIRKVIEKTELPFTVVYEATHGIEALDWLKEHTPDLIMTDIRMPVMGGLELMQEIQEKGIPSEVVIISGLDEFDYAHQAIKMGVFDYLLKPVEQENMEKTLTKWLDEKKSEEQNKERRTVEDESLELSTVDQVIRYIHQSTPGEVSLKKAAEVVHLNPSYLSQLFKQETGSSFVEYVTRTKMKEAGNLLTRTSLRVSEIADRLGYSDLSYFTNAFKKFYGQTPSEYRRMNS